MGGWDISKVFSNSTTSGVTDNGHLKCFTTPSAHAGWFGLYEYTADLLCLDACRHKREHRNEVHSGIATPLLLEEWAKSLASHPDQAFARYICAGWKEGFQVEFQHGSPLKSATRNMQSALDHPEVVREYLQKECRLGRMLGPFPTAEQLPQLHINRFGVIPNGHNSGKFRLITDLSFPLKQSVNEGIDAELSTSVYTKVEEVAARAAANGRGALLAKVDIRSGIPPNTGSPSRPPAASHEMDGDIYVDPMLPFGLRSAPKIFNVLADALQWHLIKPGVQVLLHYLDDYIVIGPPHSQLCHTWLLILVDECSRLGVPIAAHKTEGPSTVPYWTPEPCLQGCEGRAPIPQAHD